MKKSLLVAALALSGAFSVCAAEVLLEEDFAFAQPGTKMPQGFSYFYGSKLPKGETANARGEVRKYQDGCEVAFDDQCEKTGIGLGYTLNVDSCAAYRATVVAAAMPGRDTKKVFVQLVAGTAKKAVVLDAPADGSAVTRVVDVEVPAGVQQASFHVYSVYEGTPGFVVRSVKIERTKDAPVAPVEIKFAEGGKVLLDEDFSKYDVKSGVPGDYKLFYSSKLKDAKPDMKLGIVLNNDGKKVLRVEDNCDKTGQGPFKDFAVTGGKTYRVSIVDSDLPDRNSTGFVVQFNMAKSKHIAVSSKGRQTLTTLEFAVPEAENKLRVYLYSNYDRTPALDIHRVVLEELP